MKENMSLPSLFCPFPSAINKHAETVHQQTLKWVLCFNLVGGDEAYQRLCKSKFGWLVARAYPDAPLEELQIVSDWTIWLFILDDYFDELAKQPNQLADICTKFIDILKGSNVTIREETLADGLRDIRQRLLQKVTPEWMLRFIGRVEECLKSWVWEVTNRVYGITPDLATYIKMRPFTGGLYTVIEMIELTQKINLAKEVRENALVQSLTLITNNVVNYSNDIFSLYKEIKRGDVHNLVLIIQHQYQLHLQESIDRSIKLYNSQMQAFIDLEQHLPSFGTSVDCELTRYVSVLRSMMRGHLDWLWASGRYQPTSNVQLTH